MAAIRVVFDDGKQHAEGRVARMWSSGIVLAVDVRLPAGSAVALVLLSGGFDGERLLATVSSFERGELVLDLPGLDTGRFMRLVALVEGGPPPPPIPSPPPLSPPANAPTFMLSGGDDEYNAAPTGTFTLTEDMRKQLPEVQNVPASPFQVPSVERASTGKPRPAPITVPGGGVPGSTEELEVQVVQLARSNAALIEENRALRDELLRVNSLKSAVEDELKDALARLDAIERSLNRR